jgi:hypothetical protein
MTQSLDTLYAEAQLALAAYADLSEQMPPDDYLAALGPAGMGDAQARAFVSECRVVDQYGGKMSQPYVDEVGIERQVTVETGLSVTLFERVADGQRVVAIRGTDISDLADLKNDLLLCSGAPTCCRSRQRSTRKYRRGSRAVSSRPALRSPGIRSAAFSRPV